MAKEPITYPVKITRKAMFLWGALIFVAMGWMFVVGVIVGRGLAPVPDSPPDLQQELETLRDEKLDEQQAKNDQEKGRHLPFYDELRKPVPKADYKDASPAPKKEASTSRPVVAAPAPDPRPNPAKTQPATASKERFTIQVGAFKDKQSADRMVKSLRDQGYTANHVRVDGAGKTSWFRVRVGVFKDRPAAEAMLKKMGKNGIKGMVVNI
jgi:cell division protein FtsN